MASATRKADPVEPAQPAQPAQPAHLIVTASYDAGRTGLIYRDALRTAAARLNRVIGGRGPGGPAAGDNGTGVAAALELTRALVDDPPRNLSDDLVLQGAGDSPGARIGTYLRPHKRGLKTGNPIVLGFAASGAGQPAWWVSDGPLVPLRYARSLRALCEETGAALHRGRGASPALPARAAGLPAIAIGCLDSRGLAPRSHQSTDTPA